MYMYMYIDAKLEIKIQFNSIQARNHTPVSSASKSFSQLNNLKQHILIHTAEKNYCCTICTKKFSQHSNLKKHILSHDKEEKRTIKPKMVPARAPDEVSVYHPTWYSQNMSKNMYHGIRTDEYESLHASFK